MEHFDTIYVTHFQWNDAFSVRFTKQINFFFIKLSQQQL